MRLRGRRNSFGRLVSCAARVAEGETDPEDERIQRRAVARPQCGTQYNLAGWQDFSFCGDISKPLVRRLPPKTKPAQAANAIMKLTQVAAAIMKKGKGKEIGPEGIRPERG